MNGDEHMAMDWFGIPYMGYIMIGAWIVLVVIAILIALDAEKRRMNVGLWLLVVAVPMVGIVAAIVYLIVRNDYPTQQARMDQQPTQPKSTQSMQTIPQKEAIKTLDERYARGEISREEYYLMKKDLDHGY